MFNRLRLSCVIFIASIMIFGCNKTVDTISEPDSVVKNLELSFIHFINTSELLPDKLIELDNGRKFNFRYIRHMFTNIVLVNETGDTVIPTKSRILVKEDKNVYSLGNVKISPGIWKMFVLYGVDSLTNTTVQPHMIENADDPLAPQFPSMYWTWESGYIFTRIEALADTSSTPSGQINGFVDYHLGKTGLALQLGPFEVTTTDREAKVRLRCNLHPALASVNWPEEFSSHTFENIPLAERLISLIAANIQID